MNKADDGEIAKRAYAIWEREGRPHGRDFDHWLKAEREMKSGAATAPKPTKATSSPPSRARKTTRKSATPGRDT